MGRRKILIPLAAVIAALGTLMVFLYVQSAESRAQDEFETVDVLTAIKQVDAGETFDDAAKAGKFELKPVPNNALVGGYQTDLEALSGTVASQAVFPGEQITENKWGATAKAATTLAIPKGKMAISVNLSDPGRVSGFVNPGSEVAVFYTTAPGDTAYTRLMLPKVTVLGVGDTSTIKSTTTTKEGESTTAEIPKTLMTLAVDQTDAQKLFWGNTNGILTVGLINDETETKSPSQFTTEPNLFQ